MKILFPYVGDTVGGSHVSSWNLIKQLNDGTIEPVVVSHMKGRFNDWIKYQGGHCEILDLPFFDNKKPRTKNWYYLLKSARTAKKYIQENGIELVHCNDNRMNMTWSLWCCLAGIPMVWHQRVRWPDRLGIQYRFLISLAKGIISISQFVADSAPELKVPHETIYNPVCHESKDKEQAKKTLRRELGLPDDTVIVASFANAQQRKRPDIFVEVSRKFKCHTDGSVKFVWFGDDRDGILSSLLQSNDLGGTVVCVPFRDDVLTVMAGCDILLATSESEPFGRTLVEAMAVNTPVIASDSGGHREIIVHQHNGLLYPLEDTDACCEAVLEIINNPRLAQKLVNEGENTIKRFAPHIHAEQVVSFYKKLKQINL